MLAGAWVAAPGNRTWLLPSQNLPQPQARAYCQSLGGDLITLRNADEAQLLTTALLRPPWNGPTIWLGLVTPAGVDHSKPSNWRWLSSNQTADYNGWLVRDDWTEPAELASGQTPCSVFALGLGSGSTGVWYTASCTDDYYGAACQLGCSAVALPPTPTGGSGWPVDLCDGAAPGTICTAKCSQWPDLSVRSTCMADGSWTNITGSCTGEALGVFLPIPLGCCQGLVKPWPPGLNEDGGGMVGCL